MSSSIGNVSSRRTARAPAGWIARVDFGAEPRAKYLAIVEALAQAVARGDFAPGDRVTPQRSVAEALGVDLTTVTRAYDEARARGVLEGQAGRGTFVRGPASPVGPVIDLSMNMPPSPRAGWRALLAEGFAQTLRDGDAEALMTYRAGMGSLRDRTAAALWLAPLLGPGLEPRTFVAPGAQAALSAIVPMLARTGDVILAEPWTYPGFLGVARLHGVHVSPLSCDKEGPRLGPLAAQIKRERPKAMYLTPTLQNPTARTISAERRRAIVALAAEHGVTIIEDDPYSLLAPPIAPLARLRPDAVIYIATLSKVIAPGLRTAFVVAPPGLEARVEAALRAACQMPAPVLTDMALRWIESGQAQRIVAAIKRESAARMALARKILPARAFGGAHGFHVWMSLPLGWTAQAYGAAARAAGVVTIAAADFAVKPGAADAFVRISLGAAPDHGELKRGLRALAALESGR